MISQICGFAMRTLYLVSAGVFVTGGLELHHGLVSAGECCVHAFGKQRESVSAACRPDWGYSSTVWQRFAATSSSLGEFGNSDGSWGLPVNGAVDFSEHSIPAHGTFDPGIPSQPASIFPRHHLSGPRTEPHGGASQALPGSPDSRRHPPMALPQLPSSPQIQSPPQSSGQSRYQSPAYLPATATVLQDQVSVHQASGISTRSAASPASAASRYGVISALVIPARNHAETSVPTADRPDLIAPGRQGIARSGPMTGRYSSPAGTSVHKLISTDKVMPGGPPFSGGGPPFSGGGRYGGR